MEAYVVHVEFETVRFPAVCCAEFLNINLLSVDPQCRGRIKDTLSSSLAIEPQWGWGTDDRIWWCVDGAKPDRLDYFRHI